MADAVDCAERLIDDLHRVSSRFTVRRPEPHGSVHRGTALAGFADIDYLIVLDEAALMTAGGTRLTPGHTIGQLRDWLIHCRAGVWSMDKLEVRPQKHSVGVCYHGANRRFRVDLVPALASRGRGPYRIPSRLHQRWIETRPRQINARVEVAAPKVVDAIRLLKGWKRARGRNKGFSLPSHAIEVMLLERADLHTGRTPLAIARQVLSEWAEHDMRRRLVLSGAGSKDAVTLLDPWSGENLLGGNGRARRCRLIDAARLSRDLLAEAESHLAGGRNGTAAGLMERLFIGNA